MRESLLKMYFDGEIRAASLRPFLAPLRQTSVLRKGEHFDFDLELEHEVSLRDLKLVCDDFLAGELDADDVEAISFYLIASDHFVWDKGTESGAIIAELVDDWNSPEICFPITRENVRTIARGLDEGVYDTAALKR